MKKTRILSLLLAVVLLLGTAVLFSSCGNIKDGNVKLSKKTAQVKLADYAVVYGDSQSSESYTATFKQRMADFATILGAFSGKSYTAQPIDRAKTGAGDPEILIGLTTRAESKEAYDSIKGDGFAIQVTDKKVAIVGTNNLLTLQAVQYFTDKYLSGEVKDGLLTVNVSAVSQKMESVLLADSTDTGYYTLVHSANANAKPQCPDYASSDGDYRDYAPVAAETIAEKMRALTSLAVKNFAIKTDAESCENEVLIGTVAREESAAVLSTLSENEWTIAVEGTKIHLNAWSNAGLMMAATAYADLLAEGSTEDASGNVKITFPQGFKITGVADESWVLDFPKPEGEGIELYNTMDASDSALQFIYTGAGVNATSFTAYCDKLKAEGYSLLTENEAEGSMFATFINKNKGVSIYAAYNAFTHKNDFSAYNQEYSKTKTGDVGPYDWEACFRIISSPIDHEYVSIPDAKLLSAQKYAWQTDSAITTMPIYDQAVGLMYVVTLEDGSFVVFDSGTLNPEGKEHIQLWSTLESLHTKIWDQAPSTTNPVRIAAWVCTHAHGDHYNAFGEMLKWLKSSGQAKKLKIDYMIGNYPNPRGAYPLRDAISDFTDGDIQNFQSNANGGFKYLKVHTGQKLYFANLEIEVITTWEDLNPRVSYTGNDTNTVLRFTMTNKNAPNAKPVTQLWTGDANRWQSRWMCAMYGDYLKSDMVSVAHHGNLGCEIEFYDLVAPTAVWWPHNASAVKSYLTGNKDKERWCFEVDQHLVFNVPSVKYVYASGNFKTDKQIEGCFTTLWLRSTGPAYEELQDAMTWEPIVYNNTFAIKTPYQK